MKEIAWAALPLAQSSGGRGGADAAARRELGGGVRQHPGSNNCVEGAYGIARFDRREPVESDEHARSTCGVRELRDSPVRRSVGQRAAAARRPTSIVCWWRTFVGGERAMLAVPRIGAARRRPRRRQRAPATTGHRAAAGDQHDTRRHTATSAPGHRAAADDQHDTRRHTATSARPAAAANTTLAATRRHRCC